MKVLEWMNALLKECDFIYPKELVAPFRIDEYVCASSGHFLVAVKSDENCGEVSEKTAATVRKVIATQCESEEHQSIETVHQWAVREYQKCSKCDVNQKVDCGKCKGEGEIECCCDCGDLSHDIKCEDCAGTGKESCACASRMLPVEIFGEVLNADVLERASRHVCGPYRISSVKEGPLIFSGGDWIVAVMPLRRGIEPQDKYTPEAILA